MVVGERIELSLGTYQVLTVYKSVGTSNYTNPPKTMAGDGGTAPPLRVSETPVLLLYESPIKLIHFVHIE